MNHAVIFGEFRTTAAIPQLVDHFASYMNDPEINTAAEEYDRKYTASRWETYNTKRADWPVELFFASEALRY